MSCKEIAGISIAGNHEEKETQEKLEEYNKVLEEVNKQLVELAKNEIDTAYIGGECTRHF